MKSELREGNVNPGPHRRHSHSVPATLRIVCLTHHLLHGVFHSISFSRWGDRKYRASFFFFYHNPPYVLSHGTSFVSCQIFFLCAAPEQQQLYTCYPPGMQSSSRPISDKYFTLRPVIVNVNSG